MKTTEEKLKIVRNERMLIALYLKELAHGKRTKKDFIKKMVDTMRVTNILIEE